MVVSPAHTPLIFARRWVEYHMSEIGSRQWKARKTVPSPHHWDRIDQVVTYKLQINGKTQPNRQCALSLAPLTDSNLSTLLSFKELKINLMISFKYEIGKKKKAERSYILLSSAQWRILSLLVYFEYQMSLHSQIEASWKGKIFKCPQLLLETGPL